MKKHYTFLEYTDTLITELQDRMKKSELLIAIGKMCFLLLGVLILNTLLDNSYLTKTQWLFFNAILIFLFLLQATIFTFHMIAIRKNIRKDIAKAFIEIENTYAEPAANGLILQTEAITSESINECCCILKDIVQEYPESKPAATYIVKLLSSENTTERIRGNIYTEILKEQLALGNLKILDITEDLKDITLF